MTPAISIIVPTLNEERYLPRLLASIGKQGYRGFEVIVADARSTDGTRAAARAYGARVVRGGLPSVGRNRGAARARGQFFFFLDADVRLPADFLQKALQEMQDRYLDLATCTMKPLSNLLLDRVLHSAANMIVRMSQHTRFPHAPGFCILISARLFRRIGGFDEALRLSEDHDLVVRASRYRPLRVLESTAFWVDVRRFRKEGRLSYAGKVIVAEIHRAFGGRVVDESTIPYEFGDFSVVKRGSRLRVIERRINRIEQRYRRLIRRARDEKVRSFAERQLKAVVRFFALRLHFRKR